MIPLLAFLPEISKVEESPIGDQNDIFGWHAVLLDKNNNPLGGGFNADKNTARKIAVAEFAERKLFRLLYNAQLSSHDPEDFYLLSHPSSCGFAAGFERDKVRLRAISEAVERWAWSQWIDRGHFIPELGEEKVSLTDASQFIKKSFDYIKFYSINLNTSLIEDYPDEVALNIVLAFKGDGVFPGSRVCAKGEEKWGHSIVEAYRHLLITSTYHGDITSPFPYGRIFYFAHHGQHAIDQVQAATKVNWPVPQLLMLKEKTTGVEDLYLWRALVKDYISWNEGSEKRFVY